jgi:hypothetical protein
MLFSILTPGLLEQWRSLMRTEAFTYIVDCDAPPYVPEHWEVKEHHKGGWIEWDVSQVKLYVSSRQQNGLWIEGNKLRQELTQLRPYNANLLDFLLKRPHLVPQEWRDKQVFFWGTVYRDRYGSMCVRCLRRLGDEFGWYRGLLDYDWGSNRPAAVRST